MAPRRMTLRHIEAFRVVMQTGAMTEVARRLYTSQPQASRLLAAFTGHIRAGVAADLELVRPYRR